MQLFRAGGALRSMAAPMIAADVRAIIGERLGLEIASDYPADLQRSVAQLCQAFSHLPRKDLSGHLARIEEASPDWGKLVNLVTNGETYFFRDSAWFEALERHVL